MEALVNVDLEKEVVQVISEILGVPATLQTSINNTMEWDSLRHLRILVALERHYQCTLPLEEISEVLSVADWINLISKFKREGSYDGIP